MQKANSFSLFETIITLVILSIIISGFSHLIVEDFSYQTYKTLQIQENEFYRTGNISHTDDISFIQYQ